MAMYSLFQRRASNEFYSHLNTVGWGGDDSTKTYADMSFIDEDTEQEKVDTIVKKAMKYGFYKKTAYIQASGLEDAFLATNDPNVKAHSKKVLIIDQFGSMSVGDVLINLDDNTAHVCARFGFRNVTKAFDLLKD